MSFLSLPLDQWPLYKATTDLRVVLYDRKGFIKGPPHPIDIFKYLYNIKSYKMEDRAMKYSFAAMGHVHIYIYGR